MSQKFSMKKKNLSDKKGVAEVAHLAGLVEAGFPAPRDGASGDAGSADSVSLDEYVIGNRDASFMLKVKGDSMKESGICAGDMLIVERGITPRAKDIVVARIDGNFVMKKYSDIRSAGDDAGLETVIEAVVVAVVRKYR